jgi:hypothetical protein
VCVEGLDLLRNKTNHGCEEVRRVKVEGIGKRGGLGLTVDDEFHRRCLQILRSLASNFINSVMSCTGRRKGVGRGVPGLYIASQFLVEGGRVSEGEATDG